MYTKPKHKFILYIFIVILLVSACSSQVIATSTSVPTEQATPNPVRKLEEVECRTPNPQLIKVTCYDLIVPEDRSSTNTNSNMIRLHVAIFKSKSSAPASDPILFLTGGPGAPGISFILYINSYSGFVGSNRDVIVFDQRGTGQSQPSLACPEVDQFYEETLSQFFQSQNQVLNEAWLKCKERLMTSGINPNAYSSAISAADVEDLRRALSIEKWNLFGISYGTRLALTVMRDFPSGVRSAVLDSVLPLPETLKNYPYQNINKNGSIPYLINRCTSDVECNAAYPDLENTLTTLVNKLNENPITVTSQYRTGVGWANGPDVLLTGNRLLETLFFMMYSVNDIPYIPQLISNAQNGDVELVSKHVSILPPVQANAMSISVNCIDNFSFSNKLPEPASQTNLEKLWFDFMNNNQYPELCQSWVSNLTATNNETDFSSDIPSLLLAGEFDPATPIWLAELAKEDLSNSYLYQFSGYGHSLTTSDSNTNGCVGKLMISFWNDPTIQPNDACIVNLKPRKFITK